MKGKEHWPEQIRGSLGEAEVMIAAGKMLGWVAQALKVSEQTFCG